MLSVKCPGCGELCQVRKGGVNFQCKTCKKRHPIEANLANLDASSNSAGTGAGVSPPPAPPPPSAPPPNDHLESENMASSCPSCKSTNVMNLPEYVEEYRKGAEYLDSYNGVCLGCGEVFNA